MSINYNDKVNVILELIALNCEVKTLREKGFLRRDYQEDIKNIIDELIDRELNKRESQYVKFIIENM